LRDSLRGSTTKSRRSMSASASSLLRGGGSSGNLKLSHKGSGSGGWSEGLSAATLEVAKARVKEVERMTRMTRMPGSAVPVRANAGSTAGAPRGEGGVAALTVQELAALQQAGIRLL
jgi:hypothetical protein